MVGREWCDEQRAAGAGSNGVAGTRAFPNGVWERGGERKKGEGGASSHRHRRPEGNGVWERAADEQPPRHPELVEGPDALPQAHMVADFYVYILTNTANVLYIGVTRDLTVRFWQHVEERSSRFTARYNLDRLMYFEVFPTAREAIAREKQLKSWRREKKVALIASMNPAWRDLSGRFRF